VRRATFTGRYSTDDVRPIFDHLLRMERAFLAGDALDDEARIFVNENAHLFGSES
jgi:hypothetical protein